MTPEERERLNSLCIQIQTEKDYGKFEGLLRDLNGVIDRKHRRFKEFRSDVPDFSAPTRPSKSLTGVVTKVLRPTYSPQAERVEISIPEADDLFREIRIANTFIRPDGGSVGLHAGTQLEIRFEAKGREVVKQNTVGPT
jgi:hypothetical protein